MEPATHTEVTAIVHEMLDVTPATTRKTVLLVSPDGADRERFGGWLESGGIDPINCPGPHAPEFSCLGTSNCTCPLVGLADVAVLDIRRLPGLATPGRSGSRLLRYYLEHGKPVVLIADRYRKPRFRPEQVFVLRPNPGRESLLLAVRAVLREAATW
ncbi:MAG: hypothetical protein E6I86_12820 [Chloroflexi bacterium]|nr:MAG: hypothetical protein E6I86_12820 [Chloroflexota bacterium]